MRDVTLAAGQLLDTIDPERQPQNEAVIRLAIELGKFDDVVGGGFQLIVARGDPLAWLSSNERALIDALDMTVASLDSALPLGIRDLNGRLTTWLTEHGVYAVLVRPDFYVFGSSRSSKELTELLQDLRSQLQLTSTPSTAGALP